MRPVARRESSSAADKWTQSKTSKRTLFIAHLAEAALWAQMTNDPHVSAEQFYDVPGSEIPRNWWYMFGWKRVKQL